MCPAIPRVLKQYRMNNLSTQERETPNVRQPHTIQTKFNPKKLRKISCQLDQTHSSTLFFSVEQFDQNYGTFFWCWVYNL